MFSPNVRRNEKQGYSRHLQPGIDYYDYLLGSYSPTPSTTDHLSTRLARSAGGKRLRSARMHAPPTTSLPFRLPYTVDDDSQTKGYSLPALLDQMAEYRLLNG